jgi:hypothetical protein
MGSLSAARECEAAKRAALRDFAAVRDGNTQVMAVITTMRDLLVRREDIYESVTPDTAACQQFLEELSTSMTQLRGAMSSGPWMTFVHGAGGLKPLKRLLGKLIYMPVKLARDVAAANSGGADGLELGAVCTNRQYAAFMVALMKFAMKTDFNMRQVAQRVAPPVDMGPVPSWATDAYAAMGRITERQRAERGTVRVVGTAARRRSSSPVAGMISHAIAERLRAFLAEEASSSGGSGSGGGGGSGRAAAAATSAADSAANGAVNR